MSDTQDRFGALRALLQREPSEELWRELREELALWGEEERARVALPYALDHVVRWPGEVRRVVGDKSPEWVWPLANVLDRPGVEMLEKIAAGEGARRVRVIEIWSVEEIEALGWVLGYFEGLRECEVSWPWDEAEFKPLLELCAARWPASLRRLVLRLSSTAIPRHISASCGVKLAQNATLSGLEELDLEGTRIGDSGARALAQSPHLRRLTKLELHGVGLGPAGARALARSPNLAHLTQLNLSGNELGMGLAELLVSPQLGQLRTLNLHSATISAPCARALRGVAGPPALEELHLSEARFGRGALAALADAPVMRAVQELSLSPTHSRGECARLLASEHLTGLRKLSIAGTDDVAAWEAMCGNAALAGVEDLYIKGDSLTDAQLGALARSVMCAAVQSLGMELAQHTDVAALFESAAWPALRSLYLQARVLRGQAPSYTETYAPMLSDAGVIRLAACGVIAQLEWLAMPFNMVGDDAAVALADSGQLGELRKLELAGNQIGDVGLVALITRGGLDRLEELGLAGNQIGDAGAAALAQSPLLRVLRPDSPGRWPDGGLLDNKIGRAGVAALLRSPHLRAWEFNLDLYGNPLTHEDIVALAADPALGALSGRLWVDAEDAREETWRALIDSPYASDATRSYAAWRIERDQQRRR